MVYSQPGSIFSTGAIEVPVLTQLSSLLTGPITGKPHRVVLTMALLFAPAVPLHSVINKAMAECC